MNTLIVCTACDKVNRVALEQTHKTIPICGHCKTQLPYQQGVQEVSGTGLNKLIKVANRPLIVDFWADWCGPCKAFAPTFKSAAETLQGEMIFAKLNTELHQLASQTHFIRSIPTLIVFKGGVEVDRQSGAMPLPQFLSYLSKWK